MKKGSCTVHLSLRKIELFNLLHRHLLPGPQLECLRPLVQQHIESVEVGHPASLARRSSFVSFGL